MGNKNYVSKKPDKCMSCKSMLCAKVNATHWCPILTDAKEKELRKKHGTAN